MVEGEGGAGPIRLRNNKRRSLGPEWSMSEVGTPPPHNSDKTHGLGASINNNNMHTACLYNMLINHVQHSLIQHKYHTTHLYNTLMQQENPKIYVISKKGKRKC